MVETRRLPRVRGKFDIPFPSMPCVSGKKQDRGDTPQPTTPSLEVNFKARWECDDSILPKQK